MADSEVPVLGYITVTSQDAARLVEFYRELVAKDVTYDVAPFTVIGEGQVPVRLAIQQAASGDIASEVHLDLCVVDLEAASSRVERLGGRLGERHAENGSTWRQAFDPDGNVFCMLERPGA